MAFGLRIQRCLKTFCRTAVPVQLPECPLPPAPDAFAAEPWGDGWPEAELLQVAKYIRGSIHFRTSARWKRVFPETFPGGI